MSDDYGDLLTENKVHYVVPFKMWKALANLYAEQLPEAVTGDLTKVAFTLRDAYDYRIKRGEFTVRDVFGRVRAHGALPRSRKWHNLEPQRLMDPDVEYYLYEQQLGIKNEAERLGPEKEVGSGSHC